MLAENTKIVYTDVRCPTCQRLLMKLDGMGTSIEIRCPRCGFDSIIGGEIGGKPIIVSKPIQSTLSA